MSAYCSNYVGPVMWFTEMPECGTEFTVDEPECIEDRQEWVLCPKCGGECLVEWPADTTGEWLNLPDALASYDACTPEAPCGACSGCEPTEPDTTEGQT